LRLTTCKQMCDLYGECALIITMFDAHRRKYGREAPIEAALPESCPYYRERPLAHYDPLSTNH